MSNERSITYNFFHWGPFLYKTTLTEDEIKNIKKLCSKDNPDYRKNLAGLINNEHEVDVKKLFTIIYPFINSYCKAYTEYCGGILGHKIELISSWVNYMVKGESNPIHTHDENLSFVIFLEVPEGLKKEQENTVSSTTFPGTINFLYALNDRKHVINEHTFFPNVGDMFIFPSFLHHYVNPFKSEGERISLSGNLKID
tara:strand:+ start:4193 stop:4786 length:594 start_codon:yes stop_codon:yes gene_type:complete